MPVAVWNGAWQLLYMCSKRKGKRRHYRAISTPMEFTSSVPAQWPSSLLNGSWCMETSHIYTRLPAAHACLLQTRAPRRGERSCLLEYVHQSEALSPLGPWEGPQLGRAAAASGWRVCLTALSYPIHPHVLQQSHWQHSFCLSTGIFQYSRPRSLTAARIALALCLGVHYPLLLWQGSTLWRDRTLSSLWAERWARVPPSLPRAHSDPKTSSQTPARVHFLPHYFLKIKYLGHRGT